MVAAGGVPRVLDRFHEDDGVAPVAYGTGQPRPGDAAADDKNVTVYGFVRQGTPLLSF